ncbi:MAG TPA: response regulator transcription factor [Candidatus Dormibacteraeota bacterium]|nr:response regulator transcription factor [Candidatus Dormibacteraeota bacterium]
MIRVCIADDQALVRAGFRMIVESQPEMEVAGEAADGIQAIDLIRREKPDVVLMDIRMPRMDGLEATRQVANMTRVVILTTHELDEYVFDALSAGASGFLLKAAPPEDLVRAIRIVADGEALLAPSVTKRLIEEFAKRPQPTSRKPKELASLTERERDVLIEVARGLTNAEIAGRLHVAETTVKTHVAHVLDKLELRDRVQAVIFAYEVGLAG